MDVEGGVVAAEAEAEAVLPASACRGTRPALHPAFVRIGTTSRAKLTGSAAPAGGAKTSTEQSAVSSGEHDAFEAG